MYYDLSPEAITQGTEVEPHECQANTENPEHFKARSATRVARPRSLGKYTSYHFTFLHTKPLTSVSIAASSSQSSFEYDTDADN